LNHAALDGVDDFVDGFAALKPGVFLGNLLSRLDGKSNSSSAIVSPLTDATTRVWFSAHSCSIIKDTDNGINKATTKFMLVLVR
jgi:hypothetical protein